MIRRVYIFRHGETDWNREGRFQGHIDVPMNDRGREQAKALIPLLRPKGIEAILSSDLSRAVETARIVADELRVPVHQDRGLREANLGEAQGLSREEIETRFGNRTLSRWKSTLPTDADIAYEGGETGRQVMDRVFGALTGFLFQESYERIGVATHGGVIRRIMQKILPEGSEPVPIPNGVVYEIHYDAKNGLWKPGD